MRHMSIGNFYVDIWKWAMVDLNYKKKSSFQRKSFCTHIMRNRKSGDLIEFYLNLWCNFKG